MTLATKFMILIVFLVLVHNAVCSHFRGGTFTYTPVNPSDPANTTCHGKKGGNNRTVVQQVERLRPLAILLEEYSNFFCRGSEIVEI
ncbi:hypothetical protein P5673_013930 [Acropora cervicornis]|uniref:Secreted protein n=1 Tax=Acropora cervicornis TaxID=6130 RepID=A0AAD9QKM3_ACRCE|nr:hypothetical protein P5673_013929 [Acropora cervicornis]KAK2562947.1 hypothetical protein P5673_013930 [Acropora cervicornis]